MDHFVCKLCLYTSQNITTFRTMEKVGNILEMILPTIWPNLTKESVICTQCYYFLKNIDNFKQKVIDNQTILMNMNHNNGIFTHPISCIFAVQRSQVPQHTWSGELFQQVEKIGIQVPEQSLQKQELQVIKPTTSKQVQEQISDIIEISDDEEVEINDESISSFNDHLKDEFIEEEENEEEEEDDVFEDKSTITIVKTEPDTDVNPSFFNKKSEEGSYDCKLCSTKYKSSEGLYKHTMTKHKELKFFHCLLCNFFTLWKSALNRHTSLFHAVEDDWYQSRTPSREDQFLFCYHCPYKTLLKEDLVKHIRVHSRYRSQLDLEHEKKKTIHCDHCKRFYTQKYFRKHLSKVHGERRNDLLPSK